MSNVKKGLKSLYGSKLGKLLPVMVIAALVATASADVFVNYYAQGTATASSSNITLVVPPDSVSSCTGVNPCVSVSTSGNGYATMAVNLGVESSNTPQPQTYFTDALQVSNAGTTARNVTTYITTATESASPAFYGSLTVYYCTTNPGHSDPASVAGCTGQAITGDITSASPVTVASGVSLPASSTGYIALVGWAANSGSTLTFDLQFEWA